MNRKGELEWTRSALKIPVPSFLPSPCFIIMSLSLVFKSFFPVMAFHSCLTVCDTLRCTRSPLLPSPLPLFPPRHHLFVMQCLHIRPSSLPPAHPWLTRICIFHPFAFHLNLFTLFRLFIPCGLVVFLPDVPLYLHSCSCHLRVFFCVLSLSFSISLCLSRLSLV